VNPRRLIPYVVIFLVLAGVYAGLRWHQEQKAAQERKAKEIFNFSETEFSALSLQRGKEEIKLRRQGTDWEITKPLKSKADKRTVDSLFKTLAKLKMQRDLGKGDLKSYGLEPPAVVLSFTAKGAAHQLALGSQVPGGMSYYARKDHSPNILLINRSSKHDLEPNLSALRDKTLWPFNPAQVKSLKIHASKTQVSLEKSGPQAWRREGRPDFRVRSDRVQFLLRQLSEAQIMDFNPTPPKDPKATGLAPRPKIKVTLATPKGTESLFLGGASVKGNYARLGSHGPLLQVRREVSDRIAKALAGLEDRRLWSGKIMAVHRMVWGAPGKTWTAVKEKNTWKITGPNQAAFKKSGPEVEWALISFQKLEYSSLLPKPPAPKPATFTVEFFDGAGKPLFRLEEAGKPGKTGVRVLTKARGATTGALVPPKSLADWQKQMNRLSTPPPKPKK
jgi:hypothetical protein